MINATIKIPTLRCLEQYDESGRSEPYLWFCFFWADATLNLSEPISVFAPPLYDIRGMFPDGVGNNQDIPIPTILGTFSRNLHPPAVLGVLIALLEEDETPDDAIVAGYDAFADAARRELNNFVLEHRLRAPTPDEAEMIKQAIKTSALAAVKSKLSFLSKLFDNQDDFLGFSYAIFEEVPLQSSQPFDLVPIEGEVTKRIKVGFSEQIVTVGRNRYQFVDQNLTVKKVRPIYPAEVLDFNDALATANDLRQQSRKVKEALSRVAESEKPAIRQKLQSLRGEIAQADQVVEKTRRALADSASRHIEATTEQ